jgi:hypothetical protein
MRGPREVAAYPAECNPLLFRPLLLNNAQLANRQLIDFEPAEASFPDRKASNREAAERYRAHGDSAECDRRPPAPTSSLREWLWIDRLLHVARLLSLGASKRQIEYASRHKLAMFDGADRDYYAAAECVGRSGHRHIAAAQQD